MESGTSQGRFERTLTFDFDEGVMGGNSPFSIKTNNAVVSMLTNNPCKHCHSHKIVQHSRSDKSTYEEKRWICPLVVEVSNEAGYNSTVLCVDCLLDALNKLGYRLRVDSSSNTG